MLFFGTRLIAVAAPQQKSNLQGGQVNDSSKKHDRRCSGSTCHHSNQEEKNPEGFRKHNEVPLFFSYQKFPQGDSWDRRSRHNVTPGSSLAFHFDRWR